jgi:hypothetical protein
LHNGGAGNEFVGLNENPAIERMENRLLSAFTDEIFEVIKCLCKHALGEADLDAFANDAVLAREG